MSIISYAQNFEDVMLWRALSQVEQGFYIDIGAQDPLIDSVSLAFHEHGWRGIHVEPTPHYAELLRQQRPGDMVIQAAVGDGPAVLRFFEIPDTGISTADPIIAQQHRERSFDVREITVPCITLAAVFETCEVAEIHWLKIDVEGFETQALSSWGKAVVRPWIVVVESTLPLTQIESHESWESILIGYGYTPVYFDGLNRYYISDAHPELKNAFLAPPNVFDGFALNGTASASFHHLIDARYKEQISEILAQNEQQKQSSIKEIERLTLSIVALDKAHAAQLLAIQQQTAQEKEEQARRYSEQERALHRQHTEHLRAQLQREQEITAQLLAIQQQANQEMSEQAKYHSEQVRALQLHYDERLRAEREASQKLQQTLNGLQGQLATLRNSKSWRFTAPLRAVADWVTASSDNTFSAIQESTINQTHSEAMSVTSDYPAQATQISSTGTAQNLKTLLQLQNRQFVECAYLALLKRQPDPGGLNYYIGRLQAGVTKLQILAQIMASREAREFGVEIPGLRKAIRKQNMISLPLVGRVLQIFIGADTSDAVSTLNELLKRHNNEFVEYAYLTLLKRAPDPEGYKFYLALLRAGVPKIQILGQLLYSSEARAGGVELPGLRGAVRKQKIARLPLVGTVLRLFVEVEGNSVFENRLRAVEQQVFMLGHELRLAQIDRGIDGLSKSSSQRDFSLNHNDFSSPITAVHARSEAPSILSQPIIFEAVPASEVLDQLTELLVGSQEAQQLSLQR